MLIRVVIFSSKLKNCLLKITYRQTRLLQKSNRLCSQFFRKNEMSWPILILIFEIVSFLKSATVAQLYQDVSSHSKTIFPRHYVKEVRPPTRFGKPVEVKFSMNVVDINSINVEDMDFRMDMFLKQEWVDSRLEIPEELFDNEDEYVTLPTELLDDLWQPDLYFLNSKVVEIATLTHKFSSVSLYKNKTVHYSARMHAIVACQMEFLYYPMDIQTCPVNVESFTYNNQKMTLKWASAGVSVSPELKLLQYHIGQPLELQEQNVFTNEKGGNFSRLVVYFRFERQIGHHLIQTFAPSTLVVMLSWSSFWLGLDAVPGRVTLLVTCMLTLVTMFTGLRTDIPPVAYVKALDLWMAICMLFVFAALAEFIIVRVLQENYQLTKKQRNSNSRETAMTPWYINRNDQKVRECKGEGFVRLSWTNKNGEEKILWCEIDRFSRSIFPAFFILFMSIYWPLLVLR
ncbi:glycine receptor subunit alpha-4 isoform X2 [Agrilus planipennis]|uniref:Glycine receptor subunit alpha-4 isoform X2 n=1 Tax=Agrilus planipennis TaxID=224129 RepID=A0A1W4WW65_AGRPL|nr:glycine receptor subunit alpha-4 isoform X2 [Agrilus planipennis]